MVHISHAVELEHLVSLSAFQSEFKWCKTCTGLYSKWSLSTKLATFTTLYSAFIRKESVLTIYCTRFSTLMLWDVKHSTSWSSQNLNTGLLFHLHSSKYYDKNLYWMDRASHQINAFTKIHRYTRKHRRYYANNWKLAFHQKRLYQR